MCQVIITYVVHGLLCVIGASRSDDRQVPFAVIRRRRTSPPPLFTGCAKRFSPVISSDPVWTSYQAEAHWVAMLELVATAQKRRIREQAGGEMNTRISHGT